MSCTAKEKKFHSLRKFASFLYRDESLLNSDRMWQSRNGKLADKRIFRSDFLDFLGLRLNFECPLESFEKICVELLEKALKLNNKKRKLL